MITPMIEITREINTSFNTIQVLINRISELDGREEEQCLSKDQYRGLMHQCMRCVQALKKEYHEGQARLLLPKVEEEEEED